MDKKPNKYDEAKAKLEIIRTTLIDLWYDRQPAEHKKSYESALNKVDELRSSFPPIEISEDARKVAHQIYCEAVGGDPFAMLDRDKAAALIEACADKRNAPWREALQDLVDEQNGPPLVRDAATWQAAMDKASALLQDSKRIREAKEGD